jgi:hypothetical protein
MVHDPPEEGGKGEQNDDPHQDAQAAVAFRRG